MFTFLEDANQVTLAQERLEATLGAELHRSEKRDIGFPGGTLKGADISTNGAHWHFSDDFEAEGKIPRRLNWLGIYKPQGTLQITVEINTPYAGRNDKVSGFFARDNDSGSVYLMHSGRVGGGTSGVGKEAFLAWSNERPTKVFDSRGDGRFGIIVMPTRGFGALHSCVRYVDKVADFKKAVRAGAVSSPEILARRDVLRDFFSEAAGRRTGQRQSQIDYISRHGEVIDALEAWRSVGLHGTSRIVKNVRVDMGVESRSGLSEVYEAKTSTSRSDLYAGIGQLLVHGSQADCKLFLVLPEGEAIASDIFAAIDRLGITLLRYDLGSEHVSIIAT